MSNVNRSPASTAWAREYRGNASNLASSFGEFSLSADEYAHAAWEACKARCLDILAAHAEYIDGYDKTYIHADAIEDIQAL